MIATLSNVWDWVFEAEDAAATGPELPRRAPPVLMGDILISRGGEPELLRRWREDRARGSDGD